MFSILLSTTEMSATPTFLKMYYFLHIKSIFNMAHSKRALRTEANARLPVVKKPFRVMALVQSMALEIVNVYVMLHCSEIYFA